MEAGSEDKANRHDDVEGKGDRLGQIADVEEVDRDKKPSIGGSCGPHRCQSIKGQ